MTKAQINGELLESIMILKGYKTRQSFAEALNVNAATIGALLNGKQSPSYNLINAIYKALNLTPDEASRIFFK